MSGSVTAVQALSAGCQALTEALRNSQADPADAVRLLTQLIVTPALLDGVDPTTVAAQTLTATMLRRCAVISLANACATYQPQSSTEALALLAEVTALLDIEITLAADAGERWVYGSLRTLRSAVVIDLNTRAAALPSLVTIVTSHSEPSLVNAYRLYDDTTREPGMVARAGVINPLFMSLSFEALSS